MWLSISQIGNDLLDKGIIHVDLFKRKVGRGDKPFFWKDCWCGDFTLKDLYPNPYSVESNNDRLVKDIIILDNVDDVKWNWSCCRHIGYGREANQLLLLTDLLNNFQFSSSCDRWLWKGDASTLL